MNNFLKDLVNKCHENLLEEDREDPFNSYAYLRGRGVTDAQILEFKIGSGFNKVWAPEALKSTVEGKTFNQQFRGSLQNQIVFPIYNSLGMLKGIETRLIEETNNRKYTQYWLETWKEDAVFLGLPSVLDSIWETETVFLVEGMFDFFPAQRVFPNILCTLSAKLMYNQYRFLQRYCKNVVFMFDCDDKGIEFSTGAIDKYNVDSRNGFMVYRLTYPYKDLGKFYETCGFHKFKEYLNREVNKMNLYL